MEKKKEEEEIRFFEFQKKMEDIEKYKKSVDEKRDEEIKNRIHDLNLKSVKSRESRNILEKQDEKKTDNVVYRIMQYYFKSQKKKEEKERENMFKSENNCMKRSEMELKIKRIENVKELERLMERDKIEEKSKTLEEFHDHRLLVANKKRVLAIEIANQRKMKLEKLEEIMNRNKDITVSNSLLSFKLNFCFLFISFSFLFYPSYLLLDILFFILFLAKIKSF